MRILLISPPGAQADYLHRALGESAHSLQTTDDFRDGLYLASNDTFDAVLMVAPDVDTIASAEALLPPLLSQFTHLPGSPVIVAVLGSASTADRVRLLRDGVDACFVQPYSFVEMHERMLALHRASPTQSVEHASNAPFRLDAATRELVAGENGAKNAGEKRLPLSPREFLLIECLLRRSNVPVARDYLVRYAWPENDSVDPSNVNHVVTRLRRKFNKHGINAQLETISRFGYQLSHT